MSNKGGEIYLITNIKNGKKYVGQTTLKYPNGEKGGAKKRLNTHIRNANSGSNECRELVSAIREYGKENFKLEILIQCEKEDMDMYECKFIELYNSLYPNGYNLESGGTRCKNISIETRKLISSKKRFINVSEIDKQNVLKILTENKMEELPFGVSYTHDHNSGYEGFVVCSEKYNKKIFSAKGRTLAEKFQQAMKYYDLIQKDDKKQLDTFNTNISKEINMLISTSKRSKDPDVLKAMESLGITEIPLYIRYEKRNRRFYVKIKGDDKCHYFKKYDPTESLLLSIEYIKQWQQRESVFRGETQEESQPL